MWVELTAAAGTRALFTPDEVTAAQPIPCFQCGVCCTRWQPLLSPRELENLAASLRLEKVAFAERYTRPYPFRPGWAQLTVGETGGCVFLRREGNWYRCGVYESRPEVCRTWEAGLDRKECRDGLRRIGGAVLSLEDLYDAEVESRALAETILSGPRHPSAPA